MTAIMVPRWEWRAIETFRWLRNGRVPDSWFQEVLTEETNKLAAWYTKEVCSLSVPIANIPTAGGTVNRWRHRWFSGPFAERALVRAIVARPYDGAGSPAQGGALRWEVKNEDAVSTSSVERDYGTVSPSGPSTTPDSMRIIDLTIDLSPSTNYSGLFVDLEFGHVVSVCVKELSLPASIENGYARQGFAFGSPIQDADRSAVATMLSAMWRHGAAHLMNWSVSVESSPRTRTSATAINAVDNSSTTVSVNSPGYTLDLRFRNRLKDTTVPVRFHAYAKQSAGTGVIRLKDSGGSTVASVNVNSSTAQWWTTTASLPNTRAKYDLTLESDGGVNTCSLYAASLYQWET